MPSSRKNSVIVTFFLSVLSPACTTSSYRVVDQDQCRTELQVTPDRILLECEDIKDHADAGNPEGNYGFMIHVLDEEDTVLTMIQEPVIGRKDCFKRRDDIAKILRNGKSIYIGTHLTLNEPRAKGNRSFSTFRKNGTYFENGRSLQFSVIKNEHGHCYSATNGIEPPCMPPEFPIKNSP